jgi:hypothetical protein
METLKNKLTCPNKKCKYTISYKDYGITEHFHKIIKKCPVCKTRYEKPKTRYLKNRMSKSKRLKVKALILKNAKYMKKRPVIILFIIHVWLIVFTWLKRQYSKVVLYVDNGKQLKKQGEKYKLKKGLFETRKKFRIRIGEIIRKEQNNVSK